ncbi:MAG: phosphotransferase, partial [Gemmataceae bacterium]
MTPGVAAAAEAFGISHLVWTPLGGGLSGAVVFVGSAAAEPQCVLKCAPPGVSLAQVQQTHIAIQQARSVHLPESPTALLVNSLVWERMRFVPGTPRLQHSPCRDDLRAAVQALAALHAAWAPLSTTAPAPVPGVTRRKQFFPQSLELQAIPWYPLQWCLVDCHAGHFLFHEKHPVRIIDTAAIQLDHPAVDLARILGDVEMDFHLPDLLAEYHGAG